MHEHQALHRYIYCVHYFEFVNFSFFFQFQETKGENVCLLIIATAITITLPS